MGGCRRTGAYAVLGTVKALAYGVSPVPAMMMGVITGCVRRDHPRRAGRPPFDPDAARALCNRGALAPASALGRIAGLPDGLVWPVAALAGFGLRGAAIHWKLGIPAYGSRREPSRPRYSVVTTTLPTACRFSSTAIASPPLSSGKRAETRG
jgi:hypothetical protein